MASTPEYDLNALTTVWEIMATDAVFVLLTEPRTDLGGWQHHDAIMGKAHNGTYIVHLTLNIDAFHTIAKRENVRPISFTDQGQAQRSERGDWGPPDGNGVRQWLG